ncbi:MAG: cytochrome c [Akkermansiaceae bacterium]|nr:cytochrome c [Akkermansiaceae bacterium]
MKLLLFILFGCLSTPLLANDGGQLYSLHCSACHGNDGKGGPDGIFPPLANSEWVNGDAKRSILIVLYGLDGPINVAGKAYNLTKPAQGDHLTDDKIAQILTYVRSSWGNAESAVTVDEVKAARDSNVARKKPWRAGELGNVNPQPLGNSAASGNSAPLEKNCSY